MGPGRNVCFSVMTTKIAKPDIFSVVSQPRWPRDGLNSTIKSAINSTPVSAMTRYIRIFLRIVATAPEKSMSAKSRSNAILPDRDRRTMGTKIVMNTKKPKKKLSPRSSIQDRKSTRLNSSHGSISYAVFCLKKKKKQKKKRNNTKYTDK